MGASLPRGIRAGLALIALACLALIGLEIYHTTLHSAETRRDRELVVHSFDVMTTLQLLERSIQDTERGQRGYLLTGDAAYLAPYQTGIEQAPVLLSKFRQLTADNPEQQRRAPILEGQIGVKLSELKRTIDIHDREGSLAAQRVVVTNAGLDAMRAIDDVIDAAIATENSLLAERLRNAAAEQVTGNRNATISAALAFTVMLSGAALAFTAIRKFSQVEVARHESERNFQILADGLTDHAIYMLDPQGRITSWNAAAERLKGYAAPEVLGRHFSIFYTDAERKAEIPRITLETALRDGKYEAEGSRVRKDGSQFMAHVVVEPLRDESGSLIGFAKITRDITERVKQREALEKTKAELAQAQKLEALGQLTGGIAHDFNNLLQGIIGGVSVLRRRVPDLTAEATEWVELIKRNADRAASLTQRLLAFSRRQPLNPKPIDLNKLAFGMVEILRRSLGENIEMETVLGGGVWPVHADANELETAILNLGINARDAMPDGGKLTIETSNAFLDETYAAKEQIQPGQYAMLAVSDTGIGMTSETVQKAFEPFFTTKAVGKGTGLGLSQVHGFIKQSLGHIKIYSELGQGTTVKIYLLRLAADGVTEVRQPTEVESNPAAGEKILVVEDDEDVRAFVRAALDELGFEVHVAGDAKSALAVLEKVPMVKLLLTDVGLPEGRTGRQLADEARQRWTDLRVLFMTGYARNAIIHHGRLDPGVELIVKPFSERDLALKVRQVLDNPVRLAASNRVS